MMAILRLLGPHLAVVAAIAALIWWIDDNAADRTRSQIAAANAASEIRRRADLRQSEQRLAETLHGIDRSVTDQLAAIDLVGAVIQPTVTREIIRDPRLSDPDAGLTAGLLAAVNRARATGACTAAADGGIECALPAAADDR